MFGLSSSARWRAPLAALLLYAAPQLSWAEAVTLNLKDTDITAVIATVAELTGKNFIIDPRVKGKVTVIAQQPMEPEAIYEVFLSLLSVHGFATVPGENAIKIVPEVNAKQDAVPMGVRGGGDQQVTQVIAVENVSSAQLVPILRPLLPQQAHLAAYPASNLLIVSASAANVQRLSRIIARMDQVEDSEIEVIRLQHASAEEVVRIITTLEGGEGQAQTGGGDRTKLVADLRTNSILLSGEPARRLRLKAIIGHLDTPLENSGSTRVIYLRYAKAKDLVTVLSGVSSSISAAKDAPGAAPSGPASGGQVHIQADESTNALVINAPPAVMRDLQAVVRQLDVRRAQVEVKAVIAEVSNDLVNEMGVQWGYNGAPDGMPVGLVNFSGSGVGITDLAVAAAAASAGTLASVPPMDGLTIGAGDTSAGPGEGFGIAGVLRALSGDANTNILSTPTLVTLDNEEAEIVVGQNVPFVTGSYTSTGGGTTPDNPFQTIQREDVGITLKVKPQVNEGDAVRLELTQEVSSLSSATSGATDIVTNKRSLKTSVMVDSGQVLALGGLMDDQLREGVQKVPLLGDIPILGWLFSYKQTSKLKRNLMIFLHPTIMRDSRQSSALAHGKYSLMRAEQLAFRERGVALMRDDVSPLLPDWEEFIQLPPMFDELQPADPQAPPTLSPPPQSLLPPRMESAGGA